MAQCQIVKRLHLDSNLDYYDNDKEHFQKAPQQHIFEQRALS